MKMWTAVLTSLLMVSSPGLAVVAAAAECPEIEAAERTLRTWSVAMREDDVQAPRGQEEVQAPRGQEEIQAPRGQEEVQAPRGQEEVQAPYAGIRGRNGDVQAPRGAGPNAARLAAVRARIGEARAACDRGDRGAAREKALEAMKLMSEAR